MENSKIHAVGGPVEAKVQAEGIATAFVPRSDVGDLRWFPFPGLESTGAEIQLRHQDTKRFAAFRKKVQADHRGRRGEVDLDVWNALLPAAYADLVVTAWRTPLLDEGGVAVGSVDGVPWGRGETEVDAAVYEIRGRGAVLKEHRVRFEVDVEGYLVSTRDNRERLFAAFPRVLDGVVALATDDAAFARPDEEAIRGN